MTKSKSKWWTIIHTKAIGRVEIANFLEVAFQNDEHPRVRRMTDHAIELDSLLADEDGNFDIVELPQATRINDDEIGPSRGYDDFIVDSDGEDEIDEYEEDEQAIPDSDDEEYQKFREAILSGI